MSFSEWKKYKLGDIAELRKEQIKPNGKEQIYIGLEHIEQQTLRLNGVGSSNDVISNKFKFYSGDILYGKLRPYFRKVYKPKFEGVCSTDIFVIKNKKYTDSAFLFYLTATEDFTKIANSGHTGTRMPRADWNQLKESEWLIPSIENQQKIANILSSIDDKIELNLQTNQTLETIAQTLFKETCLLKSDELPDGWRIEKLDDLIETVSVTHKMKQEEIIFLNTSDILEGNVLNNDYSLVSTLPGQAKKSIKRNDILFSEIRPANKRYAFVNFDADNYVVSTKLMVLRSKGFISPYLIYCFLTNIDTLKELQHLAETRSGTFPQITFSQLKGFQIVIPDDVTLNRVSKNIQDIYENIFLNYKQTETLIALRDSLLPKLMKGEIEINNL